MRSLKTGGKDRLRMNKQEGEWMDLLPDVVPFRIEDGVSICLFESHENV